MDTDIGIALSRVNVVMLSINKACFESRATIGINNDKKQPMVSLWALNPGLTG